MNLVKIKLAPTILMSDFYISPNQVQLALTNLDKYEESVEFSMDGNPENIAEELFDITNNPSRIIERERIHGRKRSLSMGDVVCVNGQDYLCVSVGWKLLNE